MKKKEIYNSIFKILDFNKKTYIVFMGWEDGDYFLDICNDEDGIDIEVKKMFKHLNKVILINSFSNFKKWLDLFEKTPKLASKNGKHIIGYDMHVWSGNNYFIYNADLIKFEAKKLNWLQTFLGKAVLPEWIK